MPFYESVFIARQDITGAQADALADDFSKAIEDNGGKITKRENWGIRSLAYRIKKNRKGHYILFNMDAPSAAVSEMERLMRINEDILRYLTIRLDELDDNPSIIMQRGAGRDDRPKRSYAPRDEGKAPVKASSESAPTENAKAKSEPTESSNAESTEKSEGDDK